MQRSKSRISPPSLRPFFTNQQTFYTFGNTLPRHSSLNSGSCTPHHLQLVYSLCWRKLNTRANKERYTVRFLLECAIICKCSICRLSSHLMRRIFRRAEDCGSGKKKEKLYIFQNSNRCGQTSQCFLEHCLWQFMEMFVFFVFLPQHSKYYGWKESGNFDIWTQGEEDSVDYGR